MNSIQVKSNWLTSTTHLLGDFVSLFFPNYCLGCTNSLYKGEEILCTRCILELPKTKYHESQENAIKKRLEGRIPLAHAMAFLRFRKTGVVQHLLHQLKYNNHPEIGIRLGKLYGRDLMEFGLGKDVDLIVPIPLHFSRKRRRGYNQSEKFAQGLSDTLNINCASDVVERTIRTSTQTRKSKIERWENVKEVFRVKQPEKIRGRRILLVDDVFTTGATLEACGHKLLEAGCHNLSVACIAEAQ